jgi:hypothetical protein
LRSRLLLLSWTILALFLPTAAFAAEGGGEDPAWPREFTNEAGAKLVLYQPQVESWKEYAVLEARAAVAFAPAGAETPSLGAFRIRADTEVDLENHEVLISNIRVIEGRFPSLDEAGSRRLIAKIELILPENPTVISLDRILVSLDRAQTEIRSVEVKTDPPVILVSLEPAILVILDGKPLTSPIEGSDLKFAVNTNWPLFQHESNWYLLNEDAWLKAADLGGPWSPAGKLPKSFKKLSKKDENWKEIREKVPGRKIKPEEIPAVFVSETPAELILIDGEPALALVPETHLLWVTNTESDLFLSSEDSHFYYLVSGRWFRASSLDGPWSFATSDLSGEFAKIPEDHPRAGVLASVPGTPQAEEALIQAHIPQKATVERDKLAPAVAYAGDPEFEPIEGTSLHRAVNTSSDVIKDGDFYYLCQDAVWFVSAGPAGPWLVAEVIPSEVYSIPPSSPVHHVTYVDVYDYTPTHVTVGYTAGYWGVYFSYGCVVFGTGWYHPPYVYWGPYYPIYYHHPYSYGMAAWYNPYTGTYGRGVRYYGPYGGAGYGAAYNPHTGTYARGAAAWGPGGAHGWAEAYNPRTGAHGRTVQGGNAYSRWGTTAVRRGDDWARTARYRGPEGGFAGYRTSEGGSGFVARGENNLYAGKDGNVYRRDKDGWTKYDNGQWDSVDRPEGQGRDRASTDRSPGDRPSGDRSSGDRETRDQPSGDRPSGDRSARDRSGAGQPGGVGEQARERGSGSARQRDRGTMDQLDRDARRRSQGSARSRNYDSWKSGGRSGYGSRGGFQGRGGGGRRGRR